MGLLSISYVFKNLHLPILLHSFSPVQFLVKVPSPSPFATFFFIFKFFYFFLPQLRFRKPYPQSKTFLNL